MLHDLRARLACDNDYLCVLASGIGLVAWGRISHGAEPADAVARPVSVEHRATSDQRLHWAKSRPRISISSDPPSQLRLRFKHLREPDGRRRTKSI